MKTVVTDKKELMKMSIKRACRKQRFAGFLYFLGTIFFAVAAYFTLLTDVAYSVTGKINVLTFWKPIVEVFYLKYSFLPLGMNFFVSVLYLFTIVFCTINALRAIAALDALYIKGNKRIGFNQNALAMEKLGRIFSSTFVCLAYWMYFTHMFLNARLTTLFYIVTAIFLIIHFWAGIVGATASRFTARDGIKELPRTRGLGAPIIRNVLQFVFVGAMMYYMSQANIINNFLYYFMNEANWTQLFGNFKANFGTFINSCVNPMLQFVICNLMVVLVSHMCGTKEWHRDGGDARGMRTMRIFSMLVFLCAIAFNVTRVYMNLEHGEGAISLQMIFVAVIALALFIIECCMAKLPAKKKEVEAAEDVETIEEEPVVEEKAEPVEEKKEEESVDATPYLLLPVNMQPCLNMVVGLPVTEKLQLVQQEAPVVAAPAPVEAPAEAEAPVEETVEEPVEAVVDKKMATPIGKAAAAHEDYKKALKARWMARATGNPEESVEEEPLQKPADVEDTFELGEEKKVKCPHCGNIVWAQVGAPAYICPECEEKFSF